MSQSRRLVVGYFRFLLRLFFRRIEVAGLESLPEGGGLLNALGWLWIRLLSVLSYVY